MRIKMNTKKENGTKAAGTRTETGKSNGRILNSTNAEPKTTGRKKTTTGSK